MTLRAIVLSLCLLVCGATASRGADSFQWEKVKTLSPVPGNYRFHTNWDPDKGLRLRFSSTQNKDYNLFLHLRLDGSDITFGPDESSAKPVEQARHAPYNLPKLAVRDAEGMIKIRHDGWWIYLRNVPVARIPAAFPPPASLYQADTQFLRNHRLVRYQKIADFTFESAFMGGEEEEESGHNTLLDDWTIRGDGIWKVHTVQEDALEQSNSRRLEKKPVDPEHSPNFYCLTGRGNGMIVAGHGIEDNYEVMASVQTTPAQAGLVFYYQNDRNYYSLGVEPMPGDEFKMILKLMRYSSVRIPRVEMLAAAEIDLQQGQWIMPRVRAWQERIECYVDNTKIFDLEEDLPTQGKFGMFVNTDAVDDPEFEGVRFDDFHVRTVPELNLRTVGDIRFHTFARRRNLYTDESSFLRFFRKKTRNTPDQRHIESSLSANERWIAIGSPHHEPHVFEAKFTPKSRIADLGLLAGYRNVSSTHYRFRYIREKQRVRFLLQKVTDEKPMTVAEAEEPYTETAFHPVRLRIASEGSGIIRCYVDGRMVLLHKADSNLRGGSGLYVGKSTQAHLADFTYEFEPFIRFENRFEKNQYYIKDQYMKHWSSPEGEWYHDDTTKETWHKSDFFGAYSIHMPLVPTSEIHPSVEEGKKTSPIFFRVTDKLQLELVKRMGDGELVLASGQLPASVLRSSKVQGGREMAYALHCEGNYLWVESSGSIVIQHRMMHPLKGSRVRIIGFSKDGLKHSFTRRSNVKDFLFTEALHDWTTSSGRWQIINRFQCKPEWSHLNGENADGAAAMWAKYRVKGDFCVEFYAGIRHGEWYKNPGRDLNVTVMNEKNSPNEGYTVTCTGWDPQQSQRFTRFYRNGKLITETDKYTAPRIRYGNKRQNYEWVIRQGGRDIHGAWYYIKLRRIGNKIEYYFDNELIFTYDDGDPIDMGSLGIWTYRSSMMVSRVKFAANEIMPKTHQFRRLYRLPESFPKKLREQRRLLTAGDPPLDLCRPAFWHVTDESRGSLKWDQDISRNTQFTFTNHIGNGKMAAVPRLRPIPLDDVAGLRFMIKRTESAQFNFYYSIGHMVNHQFEPLQRYYHRISGTNLSDHECRRFGETNVPPSDVRDLNDRRGWTEVQAWFPSRLIRDSENPLYVKLEGFGCFRPSYIQQGLYGNKPDDRYAVREISLIRMHEPELRLAGGAQRPLRFVLYDVRKRRSHPPITMVHDLNAKLEDVVVKGLNEVEIVTADRHSAGAAVRMMWMHQSVEPEVEIKWDEQRMDTLVIENPERDRRILTAEFKMNDTSLDAIEISPKRLLLKLPRPLQAGEVAITIEHDDFVIKRHLDKEGQAVPTKPVLESIEGLEQKCISFERLSDFERFTGKSQLSLRAGAEHSRYLRSQNRAYDQRLAFWTKLPALSMARYPLLQFDYRADSSAFLSLLLGGQEIAFSEVNHRSAHEVRLAPVPERALLNEEWQSWLGFASDPDFEAVFNPDLLHADELKFASLARYPQTAETSYFDVDNIIFGPAVRKKEQLWLTPTFSHPQGILSVHAVILKGRAGFAGLSEDQKQAIDWELVPNGHAFKPDLDGLNDGVHHLLLVAEGGNNARSDVVDIPFLLDRNPILVRHQHDNQFLPDSNGLREAIIFETQGGAPIDLSTLRLMVGDTKLTPKDRLTTLRHNSNRASLLLNWQYLLRKQIQAASDGSSVRLQVTGIQDGAGNRTPDLIVPFKIDYKKDEHGPAFAAINFKKATNVSNLPEPWFTPKSDRTKFLASPKLDLIRVFQQKPYVRATCSKNGFARYRFTQESEHWDFEQFPYLAFSLHFPNPSPETTMEIHIKTSRRDTLTINLEDFGYQANTREWQFFIINVNEQMKKQFGSQVKAQTCWQIEWRPGNITRNQQFDISDFMLLAPWRKDDQLSLPAYDASGIDRYEWQYVVNGKVAENGSQKEPIFVPRALVNATARNGWLHIQAVDRAGKASRTVSLPVPKP